MANPEQGIPMPGEAEGRGEEEARQAVGLLVRWLQNVIDRRKTGQIDREEMASSTLRYTRFDEALKINGRLEIVRWDERDRHAMADIMFRKAQPMIAMTVGGGLKDIPVQQIKLNIQINEQTEVTSFLVSLVTGDIDSSTIDFGVDKRQGQREDWEIGEGVLNSERVKITPAGIKHLGGWIAWLAGEHLPAFFDVTETDPGKLGAKLIKEMEDKRRG